MRFILENYKYENIKNCVRDFLDYGFVITDIRHWSQRPCFILEKYFFSLKIGKMFSKTELIEYQDDFIDEIDTSFNRISDFSRFLTLKVSIGYDSVLTIHEDNYSIDNIEKSIIRAVKTTLQNRKHSQGEIFIELYFSFQTVGDKVFESYSDPILEKHYLYIDSINESFGLHDVGSYLRRVFDRISKASDDHKKKILIYALSAMMLTSSMGAILNVVKSDPVVKKELSRSPDLKKVMEEKLRKLVFKDPQKLKISKAGWTHLKYEEGNPKKHGEPILKAYSIGDGAITVGWGHAEKGGHSKFVVGQTITQEEAQKLLEKDASAAADGVRKIFRDWKKQGIERHISQGMFDAMVSMAFNMGIGGLRSSELIKDIKVGKYEKAGHLIKQTKVSKKFGGLVKRRENESKLFLSFLDELKQIREI